jgi:hypothetical protein
LQMVADCFEAEGLCLDRPYLGPGSSDLYNFVI